MDGLNNNSIILRYQDYEFYDPNTDGMKLRMMAITHRGTFFADIPVEPGQKTRERREAFNDYVLGAIAQNPRATPELHLS